MVKQKKGKKEDFRLRQEEENEINAIIERLEVQNPEGETFETFISTLKDRFRNRQMHLAVLLDRISTNPSTAGIAVFKKLYDLVEDSGARKIVRKARYRLEQKGIYFREEAKEKVIKVTQEFPDASEKPVAYLWREKIFSYRTLEMEFPPRGNEERVFIVCEEDVNSNRLDVTYITGSRRWVREVRDILNKRARFRIPVPIGYALFLFEECAESYEKRIVSRGDVVKARKFLAGIAAEKIDPFVEADLPETDINEALRNVAKVCAALGPYDFRGMDPGRYVNILRDLLFSRLEYPKPLLVELLKDRTVEYFGGLDRWALDRYRMFIEDGAMEWIHRKDRALASCLYQIARHVNHDGLSRIGLFLLKHMLVSLYYWTLWYYVTTGLNTEQEAPDVLDLSNNMPERLEDFRQILAKGQGLYEDVLDEISGLLDLPGNGWLLLKDARMREISKGREGEPGRYRRLDSGLIVLG